MQILGGLFSTVQVTYVLTLARYDFGCILGDFFTYSSGHTDFLQYNRHLRKARDKQKVSQNNH
jgi:hypothetical protein